MAAKQRVRDEMRETTLGLLRDALARCERDWPLPDPPLSDPDFPPITPASPSDLSQRILMMFDAETALFDRHMQSTVEIVVPYKMSLTEEPYEVHERWLLKRKEEVGERILFAICTDWLAMALDESAPDSDRWWMALHLLNGLCHQPAGQPVHQGYHLLESITLASRPGAWHGSGGSGPHQMSWDPHSVMPRMGIIAHEAGVTAAQWLMTRLEQGDASRRLLLVEWVALLLERRELVGPLELSSYMDRLACDAEAALPVRLAACLPRLIESDLDQGKRLLDLLSRREEVLVERALADVLTRLFRRIEWDAVPLLERMLESSDIGVLAAASSTVGDLRFLDESRFADKMAELSTHPQILVRRNLVSQLRNYITMFPDDERGVFTTLWADGDEVLGIRLRELMLRMEEVDTDRFAALAGRIAAHDTGSLEPLFDVLAVRRPQRAAQWRVHFEGKGPRPAGSQSEEE